MKILAIFFGWVFSLVGAMTAAGIIGIPILAVGLKLIDYGYDN